MADEIAGSSGEGTNLSVIKDDENSITMVDVLEEEKELEDDANAVLGGSDDQNCTYPQGYVNRQALYACKTCTYNGDKSAGICLACSYACHEGHELVELYTKRNFCCDCGNDNFPNNPCKLYPNKNGSNVLNFYNQNFKGVYCTCARPYPDPEDEVEDEMIQCILCEDWYHGRHLGSNIPKGDDYEEMICGDCMTKTDVLWPYTHLAVEFHQNVAKFEDSNDSAFVDVTNNEESNEKPKINEESRESTNSVIISQEDSAFSDSTDFTCKLQLRNNSVKTISKATFWPKNVNFLLDLQDTVHSYEEEGKAKRANASQYDQGMQALSTLDHVRQVEAIHEYNSMKSRLKDYLKSFAEKKKVVRKEDIDEFFTDLHARKRRRLNVNVPQFCR
uniref:Putative E3 ubiquitin-protein ligase UBR7 n=1 Tax=Strigamia maritima TaxID=126957 RepID=T1IMN0_STRMM